MTRNLEILVDAAKYDASCSSRGASALSPFVLVLGYSRTILAFRSERLRPVVISNAASASGLAFPLSSPTGLPIEPLTCCAAYLRPKFTRRVTRD